MKLKIGVAAGVNEESSSFQARKSSFRAKRRLIKTLSKLNIASAIFQWKGLHYIEDMDIYL